MKIHISLSGLIKIPTTLLDVVQTKVREKLLSYAYHALENDSEYTDTRNLIIQYMKDSNIEPIGLLESMSTSVIDLDVSGLPQSYYKFASFQDGLKLDLDSVNTKSKAYFVPPNKITVCIHDFKLMIYHKYIPHYRDIKTYFVNLDATVEHELTHYIQENFLHPANRVRKKQYDSRKADFDFDAYYTSPIEFDPTIKSEIADLKQYIQHYYRNSTLEPVQSNALIGFYVGAFSKDQVYKYITPNLEPSSFFLALKKKKPVAWKKAIKLFAIEMKK